MGRPHTQSGFRASEDQDGEQTSQYLRAEEASPRGQAMPQLCHDPEGLLDGISPTCALKFYFLSYEPQYGSCFPPVKIKDFSNF